MLLSYYLPPLYPEMLTIVALELLKLWAMGSFCVREKHQNTAQATPWNHTFQHSSYSWFHSKYEVISMQGTPKSVLSTATLNFQMDCVLPQVFWCLDVPLHWSFYRHFCWGVQNPRNIKASLALLCFLGGVAGIFAIIGQVFGKAVVTDRVGVDLGCLGLDCRFLRT